MKEYAAERVLNNKALTEEEQNSYTESLFESIKHINKYMVKSFGMPEKCKNALEYSQWRRFEEVIVRAKTACETGDAVSGHFANVGRHHLCLMAARRVIDDYKLTRYACYFDCTEW